jgi:hypothetical protein
MSQLNPTLRQFNPCNSFLQSTSSTLQFGDKLPQQSSKQQTASGVGIEVQETVCPSRTPVTIRRLHGITLQKYTLRIFNGRKNSYGIQACFIDPCGDWVDRFLDRRATCTIYPPWGLDFFYNDNFRRHQTNVGWEICTCRIRAAVNSNDCHQEPSLYYIMLLDNYHQQYYYANKITLFGQL